MTRVNHPTESPLPMQRFLSLAMALCLSLTLSVDAFAAKRFGGGKSFGSAPARQTQQRQTPQAAPAPNAAGAAAAAGPASGASRWLGPLAGIAAGGHCSPRCSWATASKASSCSTS